MDLATYRFSARSGRGARGFIASGSSRTSRRAAGLLRFAPFTNVVGKLEPALGAGDAAMRMSFSARPRPASRREAVFFA
jgi:hypothetical protein